MSLAYVDTSALGRVLLEEPDKPAIERALEAHATRVSSRLLRIELRRLGLRRDMLDRADSLLAGISLIPLDEQTLAAAEIIAPPSVATLDAIHLATVVSLSNAGTLDTLMTYDKQLADGAREHGITVLSPS
ncbi:MAG: PIN domain-containing protein [Solirubrobacteraceae bacterium]